MESIYASIIIPVHTRYSTLPFTIQSALNQSVTNIEIIIVGDGCSQKVREICEGYKSQDARIKFLDLPKAPLRGVRNRDIGVRRASSPRIFYSDDDDLLLREHVALLGRELEEYDIIDTPPINVCPEGHIGLGIHNSGHEVQRELLLQQKFRGVLDTHLAHTKKAYLENSGAWLHTDDHRVVLNMLKSFARSTKFRWKTIQRITALSFQGVRRLNMSPENRALELSSWINRLDNANFESEIRAIGKYGFHTLKLLRPVMASSLQGTNDFLSNLGFLIGQSDQSPELSQSLQHALSLDDYQKEVIIACVQLSMNQRPALSGASLLLNELLDPLSGPHFHTIERIRDFNRHFDLTELTQMVSDYQERPSLWLAHFYLDLLRSKDVQKALRTIEMRLDQVPEYDKFGFEHAVVRELVRQKQNETAFEWCTRMIESAPSSRHVIGFWKTYLELSKTQGSEDEIQFARDQVSDLQRTFH